MVVPHGCEASHNQLQTSLLLWGVEVTSCCVFTGKQDSRAQAGSAKACVLIPLSLSLCFLTREREGGRESDTYIFVWVVVWVT